MAAGSGKLCSLVLLLMALLAMFITAPPTTTTVDAARPRLTIDLLNSGMTELMSAFGMSGGGGASEPCCLCICWPPELRWCSCSGIWEGSCPSVCKDCSCDDDNKCFCKDGVTIKADDCAANLCDPTGYRKGM